VLNTAVFLQPGNVDLLLVVGEDVWDQAQSFAEISRDRNL
jgi:hypothetical protein